jgi:hypothetical protein
MNKEALLELMKSHQEAYLAAHNAGYAKGWDDACAKALEIFNRPRRKSPTKEKTP